MKPRQLTIGKKLVLINVVTAMAVLLVAGGIFVWLNAHQQRSTFEQRIRAQGTVVATNITAAVLFEDWLGAAEILDSLAEDDAISYAALFDAGGMRRAEISVEKGMTVDDPTGPMPAMPDTQQFSIPVLDNSSSIGHLSLWATDQEVRTAIGRSAFEMFSLTCAAMVLTLLLAMGMQRVVTDPIRRLSRFAQTVRETRDYSLRMESLNDDELGALALDMNDMMSIIEARDVDLEHLVSERTRELEDRNERLQHEMAQRNEAERAGREIRMRFEQAFRNAPNGMAIVDLEGNVAQRNAALDRVLELDPGDSLAVLDLVDDEDARQLAAEIDSLTKSDNDTFTWEGVCRTAKQRAIDCVLGFSAVRDEAGETLYLVLQLQDVTEATKLSAELNYQAAHDVLTGLANRRTFEATLRVANERCRDHGERFSVCMIDLDQFKVVNDTCGHAAGDELLKQVASMLRQQVRTDDLVARLGGDEFALLLGNCDLERARKISESIRLAAESLLFEWESSVFRIGASIGVIEVCEPLADTADLMRNVDLACFAAKDAGRNRIHAVRHGAGEFAESRGQANWVHRIHRAIEQSDFMLFCQPILPLRGQIEPPRLEVLVRMRDRENNRLVPPGAFFPAAERYNLSSRIDQSIVRLLIRTLHTYSQLFDDGRTYWVNLSGRSVGDARFLEFLESEIKAANLPPGGLNFEITETEVIRNISDAARIMRRLKVLGCQFALDDFGTGLSSFGYLKTLPVDYIKIDGMFVRDIAVDAVDRAFVKSIIEIANLMSIETVAEFVESQEICSIVADLGADYGQGFALGTVEQLLPSHVPDALQGLPAAGRRA